MLATRPPIATAARPPSTTSDAAVHCLAPVTPTPVTAPARPSTGGRGGSGVAWRAGIDRARNPCQTTLYRRRGDGVVSLSRPPPLSRHPSFRASLSGCASVCVIAHTRISAIGSVGYVHPVARAKYFLSAFVLVFGHLYSKHKVHIRENRRVKVKEGGKNGMFSSLESA